MAVDPAAQRRARARRRGIAFVAVLLVAAALGAWFATRPMAVEGFEQGADLGRGLLGEALLETLQRHQAVAVAFLVAGLARRCHAGLPIFGSGRDGLGRAGVGAGRRGRAG